MSNDNLEKDFEDFLKAETTNPPSQLSESVLLTVSQDLKVNSWLVLGKIAILYSFASLILLYICPQFGVSWGSPSSTLTNIYMSYGHNVCAALCAVTLVGGNFLLMSLALKNSESYWLKNQMPWIPISLSVLTLVFLIVGGASPHHHTEFVSWIIFAILSGWAFFEIGRKSKIAGQKYFLNLTT